MGVVLAVSFGGSFLWGAAAASSLLIGAVLAMQLHISVRVIGLIMGFGAGVLISAVAFDLVEDSYDLAGGGRAGRPRIDRGLRHVLGRQLPHREDGWLAAQGSDGSRRGRR